MTEKRNDGNRCALGMLSQRRRVFRGMFLDRINRIYRIELLCFFFSQRRKGAKGMATVF